MKLKDKNTISDYDILEGNKIIVNFISGYEKNESLMFHSNLECLDIAIRKIEQLRTHHTSLEFKPHENNYSFSIYSATEFPEICVSVNTDKKIAIFSAIVAFIKAKNLLHELGMEAFLQLKINEQEN